LLRALSITTTHRRRRSIGSGFNAFGSKAERIKAQQDVNQALAALDIDVAIRAHQNWKDRLTLYLEGKSSEDLRPELICHDNRCDLGKWIYSDGEKQLGQYTIFSELRAVHKMFHRQASSVIALTKCWQAEGSRGAARR
jgi:hypothetical protein